MTNLEFINQQIIKLEDDLQHYTMVEFDKAKQFFIKEELKQLNQIKNVLEAWEVVKEDLEYTEVQSCEERPEYTYKFKKWEFKLTEDDYNFEEKDKKLKKAVERKE